MQGVMKQVQELHEGVQALAQNYPSFAPFAKDILDALKDGMVQVVSDMQRGTEVQGPRL